MRSDERSFIVRLEKNSCPAGVRGISVTASYFDDKHIPSRLLSLASAQV